MNFACHTTCDPLKALKSTSAFRSQLSLFYDQKLNRHCGSQKAYHIIFYRNREKLVTNPTKCHTIIYDKMDHVKMASLVFSHKTKTNDVLMKLPIFVASMIEHGYVDIRYAHLGYIIIYMITMFQQIII